MHDASRPACGPLAALLFLTACSTPPRDASPTAVRSAAPESGALPWADAAALFRRDPAWRGGDGASSIVLDPERRLWLFGDTFVARPGADGRAGCGMPRNTIALQEGRDPRTARMRFLWRGTEDTPSAWFPADGDVWHWPLQGIRLDDSVLVFCTRVTSTTEHGPFAFRAVGWAAFRITGVDGPPDTWTSERLPTRDTPFDVVVGTAVVADGDHVHAYALREPGDHAVLLLRWPRAALAAGSLDEPEWFDRGTWRPHATLATSPAPVLDEGAPEFSVHRLPSGGFAMVQTLGFPDADLAVRTAPRPEGPWSAPRVVYHPPESDRQGVFVYAGKAHEGLWDGGLLATYASNSFDFAEVVRDTSLYFPHCVRLPWHLVER